MEAVFSFVFERNIKVETIKVMIFKTHCARNIVIFLKNSFCSPLGCSIALS